LKFPTNSRSYHLYIESLLDDILESSEGDGDPRFTCVITTQGSDGGLIFAEKEAEESLDFDSTEEEE
jgi:hypothetical protein